MERRTFLKGLVAALLSPFLARGTPTPAAAIPDPAIVDQAPAVTGFEMNHVHDQLRYSTIMDPRSWDSFPWNKEAYYITPHPEQDKWLRREMAKYKFKRIQR